MITSDFDCPLASPGKDHHKLHQHQKWKGIMRLYSSGLMKKHLMFNQKKCTMKGTSCTAEQGSEKRESPQSQQAMKLSTGKTTKSISILTKAHSH